MTRRLLVLTVAILATAAVVRVLGAAAPVMPASRLSNLPMRLGAWTGEHAADLDADTLAVLKPDDYVARVYRRGPETTELFVAYYAAQKDGAAMHSPLNCLPGEGWSLLSQRRDRIDLDGTTVEANHDVIQKGLDSRLVVYWFQSHGRAVASEYWSRAYLVLDGIRLHRTDAALIRLVSGPLRDEAQATRSITDFARAAGPALLRQLPD